MGLKAPKSMSLMTICTLLVVSGMLAPWNRTAVSATLYLSNSRTHPVSVVEADIYVTKFKTTMRLKCFAEDLELLQGVEALDDGMYDSDELRDATHDHAKYLAERIELLDVDGKKLEPKITEVIEFEIPDEGIHQGQLMNYTMGFVLEYEYKTPPEFITINQKMVAEGMLLPSELKILLKQAGSDQPFMHMMKPDKPETYRFDWNAPLLNSDASEKDWKDWFEAQRETTLGIESYSSVYSFIYITNYQVRQEVLIPLATLSTFFDIERADEMYLEIPEQDAAIDKIKALFSIGNPVEIDNVLVKPVFDRIDFYGLNLRDFAVQADRRRISMANGRVGVIMSYSTKGMPRDVKVTWDKFNDSLKSVDAVIFAFDQVEKTEFSMFLDDNTYEWSAKDQKPPEPITNVVVDTLSIERPTMKVSMLSVVLAVLAAPLLICAPFMRRRWLAAATLGVVLVLGSYLAKDSMRVEFQRPGVGQPEISSNMAADIFSQLHKNMFRAFDYHNESDIYDALAKSVDGDLLRELYLQINDSLKVKEQGGAVSRIEEVRVIDGEKCPLDGQPPLARPGFGYRSRWDLIGTVEHWGHIHERINKYDAQFTIELVDNNWKITSMTVLDENQGPVKTSLRSFNGYTGAFFN